MEKEDSKQTVTDDHEASAIPSEFEEDIIVPKGRHLKPEEIDHYLDLFAEKQKYTKLSTDEAVALKRLMTRKENAAKSLAKKMKNPFFAALFDGVNDLSLLQHLQTLKDKGQHLSQAEKEQVLTLIKQKEDRGEELSEIEIFWKSKIQQRLYAQEKQAARKRKSCDDEDEEIEKPIKTKEKKERKSSKKQSRRKSQVASDDDESQEAIISDDSSSTKRQKTSHVQPPPATPSFPSSSTLITAEEAVSQAPEHEAEPTSSLNTQQAINSNSFNLNPALSFQSISSSMPASHYPFLHTTPSFQPFNPFPTVPPQPQPTNVPMNLSSSQPTLSSLLSLSSTLGFVPSSLSK